MLQKVKRNSCLSSLFCLVLMSTGTKTYAQTEPMYGQYMYNMVVLNPAYAGNRGVVSMNAFYRNQWAGMPGAPKTTSFSIDGLVDEKGLGIGMQLYDDRLGVEKARGINGFISTRVRLSENGVLSGGLSLGLMNYRADLTEVVNLFQPNDPSFSQNYSTWKPVVGAGLYYHTDKFYMGISLPNVLMSRLSTLDLIKSGMNKMNEQHLFITAGTVFEAGEQVKVKPSVMMKKVSGSPVQLDLNTNVWLKDLLGVGVSYRTGDAVLGMLELQASPQLRVGYAYETSVSVLKAYNTGTHEVMIRYEFGKNGANIKSLRYF